MASENLIVDAGDSGSSVPGATLPSEHEILLAELTKAGFDVKFQQGENLLDVIIRFCEYVSGEDPKKVELFANILRGSGYPHLVLNLYNTKVKLHNGNLKQARSTALNVVQYTSFENITSKTPIDDDAVDSGTASLPLKHEVVFGELIKAGFDVNLQVDENPLSTIINFCDYIRVKDPVNTERVADIFRNSGHSHLVIYLYNDEIKLHENFDITDVCKYFPEIDVTVMPASESEFRPPSDTVYKMNSTPRGLALVINNRKFGFGDNEIRYGSERDIKYWTELFAGLGYKVFVAENLSAEAMRNVIISFANQEEHDSADSCIVAISTHGIDKNWLQGVDWAGLEIDSDILVHFNNINCPCLKGKPKLFFIQACRGDERDQGIDEVDSKPLKREKRYPSWSDIAIIHSTVPGYVSNRSQCEGSWFVQAMVKVFMAHSHNKDLETLLKMVTLHVMQLQTYDREMQAPEITYRGWTKSLYFNPGH